MKPILTIIGLPFFLLGLLILWKIGLTLLLIWFGYLVRSEGAGYGLTYFLVLIAPLVVGYWVWSWISGFFYGEKVTQQPNDIFPHDKMEKPSVDGQLP